MGKSSGGGGSSAAQMAAMQGQTRAAQSAVDLAKRQQQVGEQLLSQSDPLRGALLQ